jgi:hypothetical protein
MFALLGEPLFFPPRPRRRLFAAFARFRRAR